MALKYAVNNSLSAITTLPSSISGGALNLISTQTASSSASLEFSMDSTYDSYVFKFINIHPQTDNVYFTFQGSTNNGSSYGVTMTTTKFHAVHDEANTTTALSYQTAQDLAQSTAFSRFTNEVGNDNDQCCAGTLQIFNPSSSVFVKHYISRLNNYYSADYSVDGFSAGYFNTTSPITNLKFQFESGNIDDGIIKMYGVS